ncbi:LacI family DNA-binding transcriptional regulator [Jeotgalibaca sp. A122]|uniref:LacI family DNA-binding transcriptional regulator n=1 Tax=Jeotgalibaca sp. A122 TaxID=3457322 RepID=UPI003FD2BD59
MATIYDVAKEAGYSISTVSKVLNNSTNVSERARKKVQQAITALGYVPSSSARTLATKKSQMIGVVFSENLGVGMAHPFFGPVIEGFRQFVDIYNYDLLFVSRSIKGEENYTDQLIRRGVDGIVIFSTDSDRSDLQIYRELGIPCIFIDTDVHEFNSVFSDNYQGAKMAVAHLVGLGHKKIAHIHGESSGFVGQERMRGFMEAVKENHLHLPPAYSVNGGFYSADGGRSAMMELLRLPEPPTAVFVSGDQMAIGAIQAIKEYGLRVPDDISVVGFDDIEIAKYMEPALTTVAQDKEKIGQQAGVIVIDSIMTPDRLPVRKVIPVRLIKRATTASPKLA